MGATLNLFTALELKEEGMRLAESSRHDLVERVRYQLERIALGRTDRTASADDIDPLLAQMGLTSADLGNAAGTVFKYDKWQFTNEWRPSTRRSNHARHIRIWKLKEGRS